MSLLSAAAINDLARSGISPEEALAAGMFSTPSANLIDSSLMAAPGLAIPYPDPWRPGCWLTFGRDGGEVDFGRVRYLPALQHRSGLAKRDKPQRYGQPARSPVMAYFPPLLGGDDWPTIAEDPSIPIVLTEGEKKAFAASLKGYPCIALGGVWSFRNRGGLVGSKEFLPELDRIIWRRRDVYIAFDSDRGVNENIVAAEGWLALELGLKRGATVYRLCIPPTPDSSKMGLDDLFMLPDGDNLFVRLAAAAEQMREADALVAELNQNHAVVCVNGKTVIGRFGRDETLGRRKIDYLAARDFELLLADRRAAHPDTNKPAPLAKVWLAHPHRRAYPNGVTFVPDCEAPEGTLNLWKGWSVEPAEGDWSRLRDHVRDNICSGKEELFEYLMNWMARLVQHPGEPGQVAVVMRGGRGAGKGKLAHWLGRMMRDHFFTTHNSEDVTGRFSGHLMDTVLLFADESFFAGDPRHEMALNALITEPTRRSEQKYMPVIEVQNCLHLIMATNSDWAIRAASDERRYFMLDVCDAQKQNSAYFAAIDAQMENGGLAAMLSDLQRRDISNFEVRHVPQTAALADQKRHTVDARGGPSAWLLHVLEAGELKLTGECGVAIPWSAKGLLLAKTAVYDAYVAWERGRSGHRHPDSLVTFGRTLNKALGGSFRGGDVRLPTSLNPDRPRAYEFGPLVQCRAAFEQSQKMPGLWESEDV